MSPTVCALNSSGIATVGALDYVVSPLLQRRSASFCHTSSWKPLPNIKLSSPLGIASSIPFLHGMKQSSSFNEIRLLGNRRLLPSLPRASTNGPQGLTLTTGKPTFPWRILACSSHLLCFLLQTYSFTETISYLPPFQAGTSYLPPFSFESLWYLFSRWIFFLPLLVGLEVVQKKEMPHFFSSHVCKSVGLGMPCLIVACLREHLCPTRRVAASMSQFLSCWKSPGSYWGVIRMHFDGFISFIDLIFLFALMVVVLECMRRALCGMYPPQRAVALSLL